MITAERGCAAVLSFHPYIRLVQEGTNDPDKLQAAFDRLNPGDPKQARMRDAVDESLEYLATRPTVRRALLLISEPSAFRTGPRPKSRAPRSRPAHFDRPKGTETEVLSVKAAFRYRVPPNESTCLAPSANSSASARSTPPKHWHKQAAAEPGLSPDNRRSKHHSSAWAPTFRGSTSSASPPAGRIRGTTVWR